MISYIFKSSLSLLILFGLYWFLLRKEKLFMFNRFFLIFSILFSLIIPIISIPVQLKENNNGSNIIVKVNSTLATLAPEQMQTDQVIKAPTTLINVSPVEKQSPVNRVNIFLFIYISGTLIFLVRFCRNIISIRKQISLSEKASYAGHTLALTAKQVNPYSFIGTIVVNKDDYQRNKIAHELMKHEIEHIKQMHSFDVILVEVIRIIYWFNPILYLFIPAIKINHEYLADNAAINDSDDIKSYADNLINFICFQKNIRLTSGFNPSLTRKRIFMLTRSRSGKISERLKMFTTITASVFIFLLISCMVSDYRPTGKVKDIDGNEYKTVKMGKQVWMAENLKTTRYNDGEEITLITDTTEWQNYKPAFCWYNNDEITSKEKYGALYNWYAVNTNKLCPEGWHVPDMVEFWNTLPDYLEHNGYGLGASNKEIAKSLASKTGWMPDTSEYNVGNKPSGNNKTGFSAIPVGFRSFTGEFGEEGEYASWWSSDDYNEFTGRGFSLVNYYSRLQPLVVSKRSGFSVRCVKDVTESRYYADFSGTWELNLQKSNNSSDATGKTLKIIQKGDRINIQETLALTSPGFNDNTHIYILDGKETVDMIIDSTVVKSSAKWSEGKQSFIITKTWTSSVRGMKIEAISENTYFMTDNGKSLVVYTLYTFLGGRYVPPEEREYVSYYDRR